MRVILCVVNIKHWHPGNGAILNILDEPVEHPCYSDLVKMDNTKKKQHEACTLKVPEEIT